MKIIVLLQFSALIATSSALPDCGNAPLPPFESRIVGGHVANPYSLPWQVEMCFKSGNGSGPCSLRCGGSIIDKKWILSAAHCVDGDESTPQYFGIKLGVFGHASDSEPGQITAKVARVVRHPQYNRPIDMAHDIALLELTKPVTFSDHIQPICLPKNISDVLVGDVYMYVSGWGATSSDGNVSDKLRQVAVPSYTVRDCHRQFQSYLDAKTMFCAGERGKDSCQGDSGGPIVVKRADSRWYQAGVVSWGFGCGDTKYPGVYANVASMCDFITVNVGKNLCR